MDQLVDSSQRQVDLNLAWPNSFAGLGASFYTELAPKPLPSPYLVGMNRRLATELGLSAELLAGPEGVEAFTGNLPLAGSRPLASVYSGHQFGVWAGQLGDGRAILLGEARTAAGMQEFQLKGSGRTPYSRMGDGRAVLRSSIREFLGSEAMYGLGIPTTRALMVTGSQAPVRREEIETAAVVTRVAPSFIRFGHFEHFSAREQYDELRKLADYVHRQVLPRMPRNPGVRRQRVCSVPRTGQRAHRSHGRTVAGRRLLPRCDEHRQHERSWPDHRLRPLPVPGRFRPRPHLQPQRRAGRYAYKQAAERGLLEPVLPGPGAAAG
jgi:uncharacterized protein YdiU (UPF0061 family)